jgi:hypothetical protein
MLCVFIECIEENVVHQIPLFQGMNTSSFLKTKERLWLQVNLETKVTIHIIKIYFGNPWEINYLNQHDI